MTKSIHFGDTKIAVFLLPPWDIQIPPDPVVPPRSPQGYLRAGHPRADVFTKLGPEDFGARHLGPIHPGDFAGNGIQTSTHKKTYGTQKKETWLKNDRHTIIIYTSLQKPMFRDQH